MKKFKYFLALFFMLTSSFSVLTAKASEDGSSCSEDTSEEKMSDDDRKEQVVKKADPEAYERAQNYFYNINNGQKKIEVSNEDYEKVIKVLELHEIADRAMKKSRGEKISSLDSGADYNSD